MKILLCIFSTLCVFVWADTKQTIDECYKKFPFDRALPLEQLENTDNVKCYVKCLYQNYGIINEKGEVQLLTEEDRPRFRNFDDTKSALEKCKSHVVDDCAKIYEFEDCIKGANANNTSDE